jgi:putative membrane protein
MVNLLLKWILGALALLAVTYIVPGFRVVSLPSALVAVVVIGFLNMTVGLLLKVITFPFAILTLGLFLLVINALMLILASKITPGLHIASFGAAFIGAVVLAIVHMVIEAVLSRISAAPRRREVRALALHLAALPVPIAIARAPGLRAWAAPGQAPQARVPPKRSRTLPMAERRSGGYWPPGSSEHWHGETAGCANQDSAPRRTRRRSPPTRPRL